MDIERNIALKSKKDTVESAPFSRYDSTTIPRDLWAVLENRLENYENMNETAVQYLTILRGLGSFKAMNPEIYWYIWKLLLYLEQYQGIVECREFTLHNVRFARSKMRKDEFVVNVPGLQESRPSVRIKDVLKIEPSSGKAEKTIIGQITWVGEKYIAFNIDKLPFHFDICQLYDVSFEWVDWDSKCSNYALDLVKKYNLMRMVFPTGGNKTVRKHKDIRWINQNILTNPEQQAAVVNILSKSARPDPYILFGPPGTGKTSTLIEIISQIYTRNSSTRILICTPSNAAADEIAMKLLKNMIPKKIIYRMYSASRKLDDIPGAIRSCTNAMENGMIYLSKDVFITKKIVIATLSTAIRIHSYQLLENHFSYLFIDEAGQATEPQMLIPLLITCGYQPLMNAHPFAQIVIAGDPKQLSPYSQSKIAEPLLSVSMLERLMNSEPYKRKANGYDSNYVTKLVRNYRSHEKILHVPNKLFYNNELISCGGNHTKRAIDWPYLPKKGLPLIFHATTSPEARESYSPSVYNSSEIDIVMDYVKKLVATKLGGKTVREQDIGIVTPYKLQKQKIIQALEEKGLKELSVGTIEIFQGQERDIIIISTVRSVMCKGNIGFLSNPKRFNVAVTRAKALLIVIGNPVILQYDRHWGEFLKYCWVNGACCGEKFTPNENLSPSQSRHLWGKKHKVKKLQHDRNSPVIEDSKSRDSNKSPKQDTTERRRRLPIGYDEKTMKTLELSTDMNHESYRANLLYEFDGRPHPLMIIGDDESDDDDNDTDDYDEDEDEEEEESLYDVEEKLKLANDDVFAKLRERMAELDIAPSPI